MTFHYLKYGDFPQHIGWAKELSTNGYIYKIPHTLLHRLVVIVRALLPANVLVWISPLAKQVYDLKSFELSMLIVVTLSYLLTAIILLRYLLRQWHERKSPNVSWWAAGVIFVLLLVTPVYLFSIPHMYLGYAVSNRFDNPTFNVLKPFVLLMFVSILNNLYQKWNWRNSLWMALFVLCATLAKPSFTITIIPAIGIIFFLNLKEWKKVNWFYLIFPIGLTALVVLAGQFAINYVGDRGERVLIAPFASLLHLVKDVPTIFLYLFMSLLFPLSTYIIYWRDIKSRMEFKLAGWNFIVSLAYGFLLEEEINSGSNNFWNGVDIGTFLLFAVSAGFLGNLVLQKKETRQQLTWKEIVPLVLLGAHLLCGIAYFVLSLMTNGVVE